MRYRLALDIGTNSIGWAVLHLDENGRPNHLVRLGSRIFSDGRNPKDGSSLAEMRRLPRQQRRRRDRYLRRRDRLLALLTEHGLMPGDELERKTIAKLDPWEIRAKALDEKISLHELGRAIFHLNQRRGFKSNRKTDRSTDDDKGKIKSAISATKSAMAEAGCRTVGEFLFKTRRLEKHVTGSPLPVRARLNGEGAKAAYDLYLDRELVAFEFDALWASQSHHHTALTQQARDAIRDSLLHQRPLRAVRPGKCRFIPEEDRAPRALPISQAFRIYQELNHIRIRYPDLTERPLTLVERDLVAEQLFKKAKITFKGIRRILKLAPDETLNLETDERADLLGDEVAAKLGHEKCFGARWHELDHRTQTEIVQRILEEKSDHELVAWLQHTFGLDEKCAFNVAYASLPEGYSRLGATALERITAALKADVITYDKAVLKAGFQDHSNFYSGEIHPSLPYYGEVLEQHLRGSGNPDDEAQDRFGRFPNPTVHIGLNQLRRVINKLVERYGPPQQIVLELARDLKASAKEKMKTRKFQLENKKRNERYKEELDKLGLSVNRENLLRLRLWEELPPEGAMTRHCVYTGKQINLSTLFSPEVEIEHILPLSRTLDDSINNKTVSYRQANRFKEKRSPFEAFAHDSEWDNILQRASALPPQKAWRFREDAMDHFENEERDFLDRHLNETRYLARVAKEYLQCICPPNNIWVTPGKLTAILRKQWNLSKSRDDHRHHALDAAVVGVIDRFLLQRVARSAAKAEGQGNRLFEEFPEPWPNYRTEVLTAVERVRVSHKPDHGPDGALHNDTAYGLVEAVDGNTRYRVVHRVPISALTKPEELHKIRDTQLRERLRNATAGATGKAFKAALEAEAAKTGLRRVRVEEELSVIPISAKNGGPYKAYKGDSNYCLEVFLDDRGKWQGEVISTFLANQSEYRSFMAEKGKFRSLAYNGNQLVMRLCKGDTVRLIRNEEERTFRVVKFVADGRVYLAEIQEAGNLKARDTDRNDTFKYVVTTPAGLAKSKARRVFIDELGYLRDPGYAA